MIKFDNFKYKSLFIPEAYECDRCYNSGVALFRLFGFVGNLLCNNCTEKEQKERLKLKSHKIGMRVAAIPLESGKGFQRFTYDGDYVGDLEGLKWWYLLPLDTDEQLTVRRLRRLLEHLPDDMPIFSVVSPGPWSSFRQVHKIVYTLETHMYDEKETPYLGLGSYSDEKI